MKKISAIIPVYNSAHVLNKCVESILSQTYTCWEAIFIDDGSTDNSYTTLLNYSAKDTRIKVIHQENRGAGMARNNGLSMATGDYIVFIDSDDYVSPDYFYKLSTHNEDVVFIDIIAVNDKGEVIRKEYMSKYKGLTKDSFIRSQMTGKISWGGCRKAAKKELLIDNNIQYSNHLNGEEALFSFSLLLHAKSYSFLDFPVYYYVQDPNSLSHSKVDDPWGDVVTTIKDYSCNHNIYKIYANTINAFYLTAAAVSCDRMAKKYIRQEFIQKLSELASNLNKHIDNSFPIDYNNMAFKAKVLSKLLLNRHFKAIWLVCKLKSVLL